MEEHQLRVVEEKSELDSKIEKLGLFIDSPRFEGLPLPEQERMAR